MAVPAEFYDSEDGSDEYGEFSCGNEFEQRVPVSHKCEKGQKLHRYAKIRLFTIRISRPSTIPP